MLILIVLLPLACALLPPLVREERRSQMAALAGLPVALALALLVSRAPEVLAGGVVVERIAWAPSLGLDLAFRLDGLSLLFAGLILGIGLLIILYARYYLSPKDAAGRFFGMLLFFIASMLGVALAENLIFLVVAWESTSISSFLLIGYWSNEAAARQGARLALMVTGAGGLALLAGLLLVGHIAGSYELSHVLASGATLQQSPLFPLALVLVLLGAFTKSAQFPFHFWLPHAMAAPTPVSAYLHSATMVKAGIFLLARLHPALAGGPLWFWLVGGVGMATVLVGAYIALVKHDTKALLAYSTVSHLGLIVSLLGFGTPSAAVVAVFHLMNHASFKAALFMTAGIVDHECGTRDIRRLGGLRAAMPITAALAVVASASMAGVPPFNGFISKEMFLAESLALPHAAAAPWLFPLAATLGGLLGVAYSVRFGWSVFFGEKHGALPKSPHDPPVGMWLPVALLAAVCVAVGLAPALIVEPLLGVAAAAVIGAPPPAYSLGLWHGLNLPLAMSAVAVVLGLLWYRAWPRLEAAHAHLPPFGGKRLAEGAVRRLVALSRATHDLVDDGSLQRYVALLIGTALVAGATPLVAASAAPLTGTRVMTPPDAGSLVGFVVLAAAVAAVVVLHRHRLIAVISMSVAGLMVSLAFVKLSGTDLALTQVSVEVATILLLLIVLYLLPQHTKSKSSPRRIVRDGGLAVASGVGVAALSWGVMTRPPETISAYFMAKSKPVGGGNNVVNVILVDFRGFDTMGEIAVLGMAGLGVVLLLHNLRMPRGAAQRLSDVRHPLILQMISRPLLPLVLMMSVFLLMRGHNLPGGGFIAALLTAVALVLQYLASGIDWTSPRMRIDYQIMIAAGVLVACSTGLAALLFDASFLTSAFTHLHVPLLGEIEIASAMAFDIGVYLCVVGAVMLALTNLDYLNRDTFDRELYSPERHPWKP